MATMAVGIDVTIGILGPGASWAGEGVGRTGRYRTGWLTAAVVDANVGKYGVGHTVRDTGFAS